MAGDFLGRDAAGHLLSDEFALEVARGSFPGITHVNKFGRSTNVDSGVVTDIWDGANATDDVDIWVAPTQARIHTIASTSASDDGDPAGVGARTIRVYYLPDWNTREATEDITLNGVNGVVMSAAAVIIHRMVVLTKGATSVNVGVITATAAVDGTVTAQINAGQGQTQMAIYGVPSVQSAYLTSYYVSMLRASGATAGVDVALLANPEPDAELLNFLVKHTQAIISAGSSYLLHRFMPYNKLAGPLILKLEATSTVNDLDVSGGFDAIIVDN